MIHDTDTTASFSAITFNTWNCQGDYRRRLTLMDAALGELAPDLVLLQEVFADRNRTEDTARHLGRRLGMKVAAHPARAKMRRLGDEAIACTSGLAILSRHDIVWSEKVVLPQDPRDGERIAQFAEIRIGRMRLLAVNLHLSHLEYAENLRREQLERIVGRIEHAWDHEHILVGGDFNATEHNALFDVLTNRLTLRAVRAETEHPIGQGVDHLFALSRPGGPPIAITPALAVLNRRDDATGVYPSDHSGLLATLKIQAPIQTRPKTVISRSQERHEPPV